jgi:5'-3' exonuclease
MGIKDLSKFLRGKCPHIYKEAHLSEFQYKKGAVDISLFIFKYYAIFGEHGWISAFLNLIACLRRNDIHACFIYDTKAPEEKNEERQARRDKRDKLDERISELVMALEKAKQMLVFDPILVELMKKKKGNECAVSEKRKRLLARPGGNSSLQQKEETLEISMNLEEVEMEVERIKKQSVRIQSDDIDITKEIFTHLGVPFFHAPWEAETTCADLCKEGKVDCVISEDSDVLAYGAPFVITKINTHADTCFFIEYKDVLEALELSANEFLDFCIMCGTDYNKNIPKIGCETAYKLIRKYKSIEAIRDMEKINVDILNHTRVRQIFTQYEKMNENIPYCSPPDFDALRKLAREKHIRFSIQKLEKDLETELQFLEE